MPIPPLYQSGPYSTLHAHYVGIETVGLSLDHIARRDSTQQNCFVKLSCVGRCDQGFKKATLIDPTTPATQSR